MKKLLTTTALLASTFAYGKPTADIAILLDTSGSMQGLINQVRDGLWQTLNNLGEIKKDGETAELRLALYEYGSGSVAAEANFLQLLVPLTSDHTKVAEKLFATKATGSAEYSGKAIQMATQDLKWSDDASDFRTIVIAGNETIHQGPVKPIEASADALQKDILVNSIFAGPQTIQVGGHFGGGFGGGFGGHFPVPRPTPQPPSEPTYELNKIFAQWQELAEAGGGETLNIDHNSSIPYIESPFDKEIIEVTEAINETYLPFGANGSDEYDRMLNLDRQIRNSGAGSYMGWGDYRSGNFGQGSTSSWDLVSALRADSLNLNEIKDEDLPEQLRGLSLEDKLAAIKKMNAKRESLEAKVEELRKSRNEFVNEQLSQRSDDSEANFAEAINEIIVEQLKAKGFSVQQD